MADREDRLEEFRHFREKMDDAILIAGNLSIALVVGGSIVIPHLRRAVATLEELSN